MSTSSSSSPAATSRPRRASLIDPQKPDPWAIIDRAALKSNNNNTSTPQTILRRASTSTPQPNLNPNVSSPATPNRKEEKDIEVVAEATTTTAKPNTGHSNSNTTTTTNNNNPQINTPYYADAVQQKEREELWSAVAHIQRELDAVVAERDAAVADAARLTQQVQRHEEESDDALGAAMTRAQDAEDALAQGQAQWCDEREDLLRRIDALESTVRDVEYSQSHKAVLDQNQSVWQDKYRALHGLHITAGRENEMLRQTLRVKEDEVAATTSHWHEAQEAVGRLQTLVVEHEGTIRRLSQIRTAAEHTMRALEKELSTTVSNYTRVQSQLESATSAAEQTGAELRLVKDQLANARNSFDRQGGMLEDTASALRTLTSERDTLRATCIERDRKLSALESEVKSLRTTSESTKSKCTELTTRHDAMRSALEAILASDEHLHGTLLAIPGVRCPCPRAAVRDDNASNATTRHVMRYELEGVGGVSCSRCEMDIVTSRGYCCQACDKVLCAQCGDAATLRSVVSRDHLVASERRWAIAQQELQNHPLTSASNMNRMNTLTNDNANSSPAPRVENRSPLEDQLEYQQTLQRTVVGDGLTSSPSPYAAPQHGYPHQQQHNTAQYKFMSPGSEFHLK
eukprot:PhM_4_TR1150/c0_g1_i1/m.11311